MDGTCVDLHVLARCSCCGAVIVRGLGLQFQDLNHVLPSSRLAGGEVFSCRVNGWVRLLVTVSSSCLVA